MQKQKDGYYTNRHACFLLQYHLILITKYRKPVITGALENSLKEYIWEYFRQQGCVIIEMNNGDDHIHILFEAPPSIALTAFINALKSASSRRMRKLFANELAKYLWKPYFWSNSYFIATVSDRSSDIVKAYIQNQKG